MAFLHVQKVYHLDLVAHPFQQAPAVAQQFALTVQHKVRDMGRLEQVGLCIEPAFSCSAAAAYQGIERPAVLFPVQPHTDVLGKNAVLKRVFIPVFLIHGPRIAPFGRAVFFTPSVVAPGRKINAYAQPIGGNKNEDSFYTVLAPHDLEWMVHCRRQGVYNFRKAPGKGRRNQKGEPDTGISPRA